MIKRYKVQTYIDRLFCVDCKEEMKYESNFGKEYKYHCPNCMKIETKTELYPKLVYEDL